MLRLIVAIVIALFIFELIVALLGAMIERD